MNIKVYNYRAYDVKIRYEYSEDIIWRDFLIPENTSFNEIENIIKITFDKDVSFDLDDKSLSAIFNLICSSVSF